ncbi:pentatricopeptide repeat-containing protein [Chrysochromulina tobinii]|uniref:Pentatricopeptide repeat-containing protein n=1 Tax=Chrysochromulina tobinii TaxID=1460289 RepID=A0A0M0K5S3_9EUKA|nr:pentatricopeptide repeat-containing protein [Chrysochromulina tobinii]|eukprot:KOO34211.1 pentatricopeptide repeat-containing protein [Chrysochromulina sp. CCMP291]
MNRKERRLALRATATATATEGSALPPLATARSVPPAAAAEAVGANRKGGGPSAHSRVVEFNKRIHALGRERKLGAAFTCFEELLAEGLKPTAVTFNVLIGVAAKCGDNGRAATLLADMRSRSLMPTATTYAAVVNGLCLTGELQAAEATLVSAVEQLHTVPDLRSCKAYLRACLVWGDVERVEPFVDRMLSEWSVPLDAASADYAGRCLCMGLRVEAAEALLARQPQLTPSVALHLAFATAHAARLEWSRAAARLRSASARLEEGAETALYEDRDEQSTEGWQQQAFLQHREAESRPRAVADGDEDEVRPTKRRKRGAASDGEAASTAAVSSSGGDGDKPSTAELRRHLRQTEALYARVVLALCARADDGAVAKSERRVLKRAKRAVNSKCQAIKARIGPAGCQLVNEGWPAGFGDGGASYFDRLWASRAKQRRFYIEVRRPS